MSKSESLLFPLWNSCPEICSCKKLIYWILCKHIRIQFCLQPSHWSTIEKPPCICFFGPWNPWLAFQESGLASSKWRGRDCSDGWRWRRGYHRSDLLPKEGRKPRGRSIADGEGDNVRWASHASYGTLSEVRILMQRALLQLWHLFGNIPFTITDEAFP